MKNSDFSKKFDPPPSGVGGGVIFGHFDQKFDFFENFTKKTYFFLKRYQKNFQKIENFPPKSALCHTSLL